MTWREVCADPSLRKLPYKLELNQYNRIEGSPIESHYEGARQEISRLLRTLKPDGVTLTNCPLKTAENVKVLEVAWMTVARHAAATVADGVFIDAAPQICVEFFSPRNRLPEKMHKGSLYLQAGAEEFWLCNELGDMRFFDAGGALDRSRLCPDFPARIEFRR